MGLVCGSCVVFVVFGGGTTGASPEPGVGIVGPACYIDSVVAPQGP